MQIQTKQDRYHVLEKNFESADELCSRFVEELLDAAKRFGDVYGVSDVERIANRHYEGFIPYKDGGWQGVAYGSLNYACGSGYGPKAIHDLIESTIADAAREFERQTSIDPNILYEYNHDNDYESLGYKMLEQWWEFQDSWLSEGSTYFYYARVYYHNTDNCHNETGKDEAYFLFGLNTDLEYGRDNIPWLSCYGAKTQQSEWAFERTVKVADITKELIDSMVKEALDAIGKL